jgi:hypothetical protein
MKKTINLIIAVIGIVLFSACSRVAPNYAGVLMENYGKNGKWRGRRSQSKYS